MTRVMRLWLAGVLCAGALACDFPVTPAPDFPTGITAVPVSSTQVLVSWDQAPRAEQYRVRVSAATQAQGGTVYDKKTKTLSVRVDGLQPGQFYTVQVAAINGTGTSVYNEISVAPYPVAPTGLAVRQLDGEGFHVEWPASRGATEYRVHKVIDGVEATIDTPFLELEDLGCSRGQKVAYRVEALPDPLGKQVFVEGRGACGVKRELCVLDGQSGVLRFEPGLSGDGAPTGSFAAPGGDMRIDKAANEVFVLTNGATWSGVSVYRLGDPAGSPALRELHVPVLNDTTHFESLAGFALSQTDGRVYFAVVNRATFPASAHLLSFDRASAGSPAPLTDTPLPSITPSGAMLAWGDEVFVAGASPSGDTAGQTAIDVVSLDGVEQRLLFTQTQQNAQVTALEADLGRGHLIVGEGNSSAVKVYDRDAQGQDAPLQTASVVGIPRGLAYDVRTDEMFAIDLANTVQVVDFSGAAQSVKLRSLAGPSTGMRAAVAIGFCE